MATFRNPEEATRGEGSILGKFGAPETPHSFCASMYGVILKSEIGHCHEQTGGHKTRRGA